MTWILLRAKRNKLLEQTDKYMLSDFPITTQKRTHYKNYRAYLRDLPKLYDDNTISKAKVKTFEEWLDWQKSGEY